MVVRRSGRAPKPNALYAQSGDLSFLDEHDGGDEHVEAPARKKQRLEDQDEDYDSFREPSADNFRPAADFVARAAAPFEPSSAESEGVDDDDDDDDDEDDDEDDEDSDADAINFGSDSEDGKAHSAPRGALTRPRDPTQPYSQSVQDYSKHASRKKVIRFINGSDPVDSSRIFARLRLAVQDGIVPARTRTVPSSGPRTADQRDANGAHIHDWFQSKVDAGRFMKNQKLVSISADAYVRYQPPKRSTGVSGAPGNKGPPQFLKPSTPVPLASIWKRGTEDNADASGPERRGWILDLQEGIHCMDWLPNDQEQYLAVASRPDINGAEHVYDDERDRGSLGPGDPLPARIDVWMIPIGDAPPMTMSPMSTQHAPTKLLSLCTEFGNITDLKWCPKKMLSRKGGPFAMLATVHADGFLRIFGLDLPKASNDRPTQLIKMVSASFTSRPVDTVFSCVRWISSTIVAAGCGNGFVAVFDLVGHYDSDATTRNAEPYIFEPVHDAYVLSIDSCKPSFPYIISTTSIDGTWRVTDLRSMCADKIDGQRHRLATDIAVWYDPLIGFLTVEDQPKMKTAPLRRIAATNNMVECEAAITTIAVSPVHNSVVFGTADGSTIVLNPALSWWKIRKRYPYHLTWFKHEWKPGKSISADDGLRPEKDYPHGASLLTSGFRVDKATERPLPERVKKVKTGKKGDPVDVGAMLVSALYHRQTGIKTLSWNPNFIAGGWVATGIGNGLLLIEDISWA